MLVWDGSCWCERGRARVRRVVLVWDGSCWCERGRAGLGWVVLSEAGRFDVQQGLK